MEDISSCPGDFSAQRKRMLNEHLIPRGITDPRVLNAMQRTPREEFVPAHLRRQAYADCPLPIGNDQTISQPYTVAFMAQSLQLGGTERVLEVGAGSGYAAAVLANLASQVHTIERIPELAAQAQRRLQRLGYDNVFVHAADGSLGLPDHAPFDAIIVAAGAAETPAPLVEQLADGGRLVIPVGGRAGQSMLRVTRQGEQLKQEALGSFAFVPLIGKHGWKSDI